MRQNCWGVPTLIGTKCDVKTGTLIGKNCKGEEKLRRIEQNIGPFEIRAMYTDDAKADGPRSPPPRRDILSPTARLRCFRDKKESFG